MNVHEQYDAFPKSSQFLLNFKDKGIVSADLAGIANPL